MGAGGLETWAGGQGVEVLGQAAGRAGEPKE